MADHDQRLKVTLKEFVCEFLALIRPNWLERIGDAPPEWQQQEVFIKPPEGERRLLDLVARVELKEPIGTSNQALLHIEVESGDSRTNLRERMPMYNATLGNSHGLPALSMALYLGIGLDGIGWEEVEELAWEDRLRTTRWPYLGLPGLNALDYLEGDNLLGTAFTALMRAPEDRKPWIKATAMQRIAESALNAYRKHLLADFVEAYMPLIGPHREEYDRLLLTEKYVMAVQIGQTSYDLGMEKGVEKGVTQGERRIVMCLLQDRFGALSDTVRKRVESLSEDELINLSRRLFNPAARLEDLGLEDTANP